MDGGVPGDGGDLTWAFNKAGGPPVTANLPGPALAFPLTHLWFLYVLIGLYATTLAGRTVFVERSIRAQHLKQGSIAWWPGWMSVRLMFVLTAIPLAAALYATSEWQAWFGIPTPYQSLIPNWTAMVPFATAFWLGWLAQRQRSLLRSGGAIGRSTWQWPWP